jgi:hypothetical protein
MIVDNHFTRQYNPEDSSEHHVYEIVKYQTNQQIQRDVPADVFMTALSWHAVPFV